MSDAIPADIREEADRILIQQSGREWHSGGYYTRDEMRRLRDAIAAALLSMRERTLEEAAKVAEHPNAGLDPPDGGSPSPREMCLNIASAIRALQPEDARS